MITHSRRLSFPRLDPRVMPLLNRRTNQRAWAVMCLLHLTKLAGRVVFQAAMIAALHRMARLLRGGAIGLWIVVTLMLGAASYSLAWTYFTAERRLL